MSNLFPDRLKIVSGSVLCKSEHEGVEEGQVGQAIRDEEGGPVGLNECSHRGVTFRFGLENQNCLSCRKKFRPPNPFSQEDQFFDPLHPQS